MDELRGRPFSGADRWAPAVYYPLFTLIAVAFVYGVTQLDDPLFLIPIAWYTAAAIVPSLALTVAYLVSHHLPDGREGTVNGEPAIIVAGWPWQWWWERALDAGLAILSAYLFVSSLGSPEARPLAPIALAIPLIWFGVSTLLVLTGRRRLDAVMLTDTALIRDSINGRESIHRDQITDVTLVADWVFVKFSGQARRRTGPRPWRRDHKLNDSKLMIDPEILGPGPEKIITWLRRELDLDLRLDPDPEAPANGERLVARIFGWLER